MLEAVFASFGVAVLVIVVIHVVAGSLFGLALATWTRFPVWLGILLGVVTPVVGPAIAAIVVTARRGPDEAAIVRPRRLRLNGLALAVPAVAMLASLLLPWWITRYEGTRIPLMPTGNFLDTVIIVSLIIVAAVGVLVGTLGMVHLGAALLTAVITFWAFALFALGAATRALQETLVGVSGLSLTLGDLVRFFGLSPSDLPLEELGVDPEQLDLTDIAGSASVEFGTGWYVMIGALLVTLVWTVRAAVVPARRNAGTAPDGARAGAGAQASVAPGAVVPGSAVPGALVPGSVAPRSVAPGSAMPGSAMPGSVVPSALAASGSTGVAAAPSASPWGQTPAPWVQNPPAPQNLPAPQTAPAPQSLPAPQNPPVPQSPAPWTAPPVPGSSGAQPSPPAAPSPWDEVPPSNPWSTS